MRLMLKEIFDKEIVDKDTVVKGWVKSLRKSKAFCFIVLNDGTTFKDLQIVVDGAISNYEDITKLTIGSSVSVDGKLVASQGKNQSVEMQATAVEIIGGTDEDYPLQKKGTSFEFLREISHLRPRTNSFGAVFRVRHTLSIATHEFFSSKGLFNLHTPIITKSDCEGAGDMFQVTTMAGVANPDYSNDYFGDKTFLNVSGQLEAECFAVGMGGVYTFGPTFRSENSHTTRHLAEFWMIEPEVAFADLDDMAELASEYIKFLIQEVLDKNPDEMEFFDKRIEKGLKDKLSAVLNSEFKKITYTEAVEILNASGEKFEYKVAWGDDLQTEHERFLAEKHFNGPVIVTDYPKGIKSFYMKQNDDGKTVRAMDVLVPGVGELMGGSQREDDPEKLKEFMKVKGLPEKDYWWYLDLRRFGSVPHSGFGMGFERAIMYITGMSNIRDVIPFARYPKNAEF